MRGGTANCSVTLADEEIGTPLIEHPSILVAMNGPSLERFGGDVVPGGTIVVNGSMVERPVTREDVTTIVVPANEIAERLGEPRAANMVLLGALLARGGPVSCEAVLAALPQAVPGADARMLDLNRRALQAGRHAAQDGV
jgi:2-oxoglutarate ferredoxin oxidoreductase subunit gamma